jgi:protein-S-isoprenylcysteine O-methyltransferase Ste14
MGDVPFENREKIAAAVSMIITLLLLVASIFLPLILGTAWFYVGLAVYLVGLVMFLSSIVTIAKTPADRPFTDGTYRYSRHPMVIGESLTFIGAGLATASLLFVALAVILMFVAIHLAVAEERGCLEIYGDEYQAYLDRTSRWIGVPK